MNNLILIEDSRQQRLKHNHKRDYFRSQGIVVRKEALDCGDYTLINDRSVVVDTKKDIQELIGDIQVKQMPLKEIIPAVDEIYEKYNLQGFPREKLVRVIYDSDEGRYPEREILLICNEHNFPDDAEKEFQKLYVKRHGFFHRGLKRAEYGEVKLYVLIEDDGGYCDRSRTIYNKPVTCIEDLFSWRNPRLFIMQGKKQKYPMATKGATLAKALKTMEQKYGVTFRFCKKEAAGAEIIKILTEGKS